MLGAPSLGTAGELRSGIAAPAGAQAALLPNHNGLTSLDSLDCGLHPRRMWMPPITAKWMLSIDGDRDTLVVPIPIPRSLAIRRESEGPRL